VPQSSGVILQTMDSKLFGSPPKAHPHNVYVVSYRNGGIRAFPGVPSMADRRGSSYCYIVDIGEHRVADTCMVASAIDAYSFTVEVSATWKVTDPLAVVAANLTDGNEVVLARLKDELWVVGRQYLPENASAAEATARTALSAVGPLPEGITMLRSSARFRADAHLTGAVLEMDQSRHQGNLDAQRMEQLRQWWDGSEDGAILLHLLRHQDDTGTVLQMIADGQDKAQALRLTLLDRMLEHKLITDADAQPLRDQVMGISAAPPVTMRPIKNRPAPLSLPSTVAGSVVPDPAQAAVAAPVEADQPGPAQPPSAQPPSAQPAPSGDPGTGRTGSAPGGVKEWKQLKKRPGQDPA
jgi:hypothetical protein